MTSIKDLGCLPNIEMIKQFVSLDGKFVSDAGCGSMTFTRLLLDLGARVLAIDPDPVQAELNRAAEPVANLEFVEAGAEVRQPKVKEAFERLSGAGHRFASPKQVTFLQGPKT